VEAPQVDDLSDRKAVLAALKVAYGDSSWVPLPRLADEIADPSTDEADARRFYFNQLVSSADQFVNITQWTDQRVGVNSDGEIRVVEPGELIGLGFDGSIAHDTTALYGCTADGFVFEIGLWERPKELRRTDEWRVDRLAVDQTIADTFDTYQVGRMFCDPPKWDTEIAGWVERFGNARNGDPRVVAFDTNQSRKFGPACRRFETAVAEGTVTHDGKRTLTDHLAACARKKVRVSDDDEDGRTMFVITKADTRKIDAAVAAVLAHEAAVTMAGVKASTSWYGGWA
jgi:hypothetical protein